MSDKIIFMGTPNFSVPTLRSLFNSNYKIEAVFTQPPKKKSRGQKIIKSPVHLESIKLNIPVRHPNNLNSEEELNFIKNLNVKYVVVVAYGQIIPEKILNISNIVFLNIHASCYQDGEEQPLFKDLLLKWIKITGISIMKIIPKLDAGPYMMQEQVKIEKEDNFLSLSKKLSILGSKLIIKSLEN